MTTYKLMIKPMYRMACAVLLSMFAMVAAAADGGVDASGAPNNIEKITYSALQGGKIEVRVTLKQPLSAPPAGFTTNNPPRIALDFPGTGNLSGKNTMEVGEGMLRTMNIVQAGNRTRLVMNLAKPVSYETRIEGNNLVVALQGAAVVASTTNETTRFAEAVAGAQKHTVNDIDFRRGSAGEGRVVVGLSDSTTGIDIRKQGKNLIVEFVDTAIPVSQERKLDVADFGTPVRMVSTASQGKNVRMVIEPQGLWEYSAYQADRQFIVDVKKIVEDPNKMVPGSKQGYAGEKLSLNFQNVEVRTVLQVIADFTNLNIITSDSVSGSLTLRLKDVPWDQALDIILGAKGLDKRKNGNVVWIAPRDELAVKEKAELEARQQVIDLEPLQTEYYPLNYLRADVANKMLLGQAGTVKELAGDATCKTDAVGIKAASQAGQGGATAAGPQKILSKRGTVTYDQKTNMLIVNDIASKHEEIRRLLTVIDVPAKQVMIEARIVAASDGFSKQLGVRLGTSFKGTIGDKAYSSLPQPLGTSINNVNLPAGISSTGAEPGTLALTLMNLGGGNLINLEISAMESDSKGTVLSNPRVMTSNQRPAAIVKGIEFPVLTTTYDSAGRATVTTTYKEALLCLLVNPQVLNNDSILLDVEIQKDDAQVPDLAGNRAVDVNRVKTQILVNNGDTAVLGGIFLQDTKKAVDKVPLFGDIPVLGNLFKRTIRSDEKEELMIFITPRIIKESLNIQ